MPAETTHHVGGTKHFECRVKGHPRPEIRWYKDGKEISHISRYQFDHSHDGLVSMVIPNISHDDEGQYRCRAENSEGFASTSAYLYVRGQKEHPEEATTSFHAMQIEEAVFYTDQEKAARKEPKVKSSDSHLIEEINGDYQKKRKLVLEVEEVVHKSSRVSSTTTTTTTTSTKTTSSSKKSGKESPEEESAKISVDMLEKSYHSSDESTDDAEAVRLRKISEKSETFMKESPGDNFSDDASSLLMRQTKRLFSHDYSEGTDLLQMETSTMLETSSVKTKTTSVSASKTSVSASKTTVSTSEFVLGESSTSNAKSASEETGLKSGELDAVTDKRGLSSAPTAHTAPTAPTAAKTLATSAGNGEVPSESSKTPPATTSQARSAVLEVVAVEGTTSRSITQVSKNVHVTVEESKTESRSSRSLLKQTETSSVSEGRSSTSLREESEYGSSSLTQYDSGFLESSKSDDSQMLSLTTDVSDAAAEVQETAVTEAREGSGKLYAATEVDAKSRKVSDEEPHLLKAARDEEEEETESATESDTGSVGSVVGVDVDLKAVQRQKLQKQESKEKDDTEEEARLAALATADSRLAEKAGLPGRRADDEELVDDKKKTGLLDRKKIDTDEVEVGKKQTVDSNKKTEEGNKKGDFDVAKQGDDFEEKKSDVRKKAQTEDRGEDVDGKKEVKGGEDKFDDLSDFSKSGVDSQDTDSVDSVRKRRTREEREVDRQFRDDEATVEQTGSWIKKVEEEKDKEKAKQKELEDATSKGGDRADDIPSSEPRIVHKLKDTTLETGKTLKLRTQVTASPRPKITWSKDNKVLREGGRITLVTEDDVYSLEIEDLTETDAGRYRLTAVNSLGEVFSDVTVNVTSAVPSSLAAGERELSLTATVGVPQFLLQPSSHVIVAESETIKLICKVAGDPAPKISWEKDGQVVRSNRRVRVYESRGLYNVEIHDCEAEDVGQYVCVAVNSRGQATASINVIIEGVERVMTVSEPAESEDMLARPTEEAPVGATAAAAESSSDVCSRSDSRTVRYLKLVGMAAAFSLAALGVKKVMDNLTK